MTDWRTGREFSRTAQKWSALAERRRAAYVALYGSGNWKNLYTEERFAALMREAVASAEAWARIAPLPAEESITTGHCNEYVGDQPHSTAA